MNKMFWPLLIVILIIAAYLRIVNLDTNPPHLGNDEISIAYDSYSVREMGKDEHGNRWPLSFQSHQTYKAPLYAYLNMPLNWWLGNNEYGVRVLSVLAGVVGVLFIAMIGRELVGYDIGLIAAMLLTINPKNIISSRIAFESNLAMAVLTVGIYWMIKFIKSKKKIYSFWAGLMLGFSVWAYHTEWGLAPMLLISWMWLTKNKIHWKSWWSTVVVLALLSLPIYYDFVKVQLLDSNNRATSQLWFSSGTFGDYQNLSTDSQAKKKLMWIIYPLYSYLDHFSLSTNFTSGADLFNTRSPLMSGWFLLMTLPLLIVGLINIRKIFNYWWTYLLVWWLLCPIIPSTTGSVASVRNLAFIVPTVLIMSAGFKVIMLKNKWMAFVMAVLVLFNFFIFSRAHYAIYPIYAGDGFQYGYKQAWEFIKPNIDKYDKVVVENRFGLTGQFVGVPHLYFGYFGAFSLGEMQSRTDDNGTRIGKFVFKYVDWNKEIYQPNTIYIVSAINPKAGDFTDKITELGVIRNTNFEKQFLIYEVR